MGKPTGFMDYQRQDCHVIPPEERIGNWKEFKPLLNREEQQQLLALLQKIQSYMVRRP